jgi:hypothetical protein
MLKHQNRRPVLLGKLDNSSTYEVSYLFIACAHLAPQSGIVLLACGKDACLRPLACNPSKQLLPKAGYRSAPADEAGSKDRTFNGLDGAYGQVLAEVQIDGTELRFSTGCDLVLNGCGAVELLLHGGM